MRDYVEASRLPFSQSIGVSAQIAARARTAMESADPLEVAHFEVSALLADGDNVAFLAAARAEALCNLTLTAIAAKRYHLEHGQWPSDLQSLGEFLGEMPLDPYDGKPLRMMVRDEELVIYSIGLDGRDNGGTEIQDRNEPDIVVQLK
jgi:hypothetical protein